jgi:hypothetical protein
MELLHQCSYIRLPYKNSVIIYCYFNSRCFKLCFDCDKIRYQVTITLRNILKKDTWVCVRCFTEGEYTGWQTKHYEMDKALLAKGALAIADEVIRLSHV